MQKDYFEYHYGNVCSLIEESLQEGNSKAVTMNYLAESYEGLNLLEVQEILNSY